jgi:hypothetical protein
MATTFHHSPLYQVHEESSHRRRRRRRRRKVKDGLQFLMIEKDVLRVKEIAIYFFMMIDIR